MNFPRAETGLQVGLVCYVAQCNAFEVFQLELFRPRVLQGTPVPSTPSCLISSDFTPPCLHLSACNPRWVSVQCFFLAVCSSRGALLIVFLRGRITLLESTENTFPSLKNVKVPLSHRSASQPTPEALPLLVWGQTVSHGLGSFRGKGRERTLSLLFFLNQENVRLLDNRSPVSWIPPKVRFWC